MKSHHREVRWYFLLELAGAAMFDAATLFGQDRGATPNIFHAEFMWLLPPPTTRVSGLQTN